MKHELWYSVVVRDRHGKVVSRERRRSKSFLKQWNELVCVQLSQANVSMRDTSGNLNPVPPYQWSFGMNAIAGNTDYGIRVGTGNTPVAIDDYALDEPIDEGDGAGQMEHLICTVAGYVVAAPSCSFEVSRTIVNNSPAVITVREAVIYMQARYTDAWYCATRDILTVPQAVPIGGSITIDWTIQVTV
ncbi:unnamed protein product [marine sediment metagenome]|uniref:Uncharacterized protein n=1 Tax=marine sediment metagenome TaxID=412755 RepID=X1DS31_9ZZZZ